MAASRSTPPEVTDPVAGALAQAGVARGSRVCCCLSGGVDSVVLLHRLCELRHGLGFALSAAHVHHGLSANADHWLAFCGDVCARLEVPFIAFRVDVRRDDPHGTEAAAREARHAALKTVDCDWLVFGHHQDDQAETLLFRLFRGAGVRGAAAMAAVEPPTAGRAGRLRPLLGVRRAQIEAWARAHALAWVEDESNADRRFARNDIRHRIVPAIEQAFPGAVPALARAADHFNEAAGLLDQLARQDEAACGGAMLDRDAVLRLDDARIANLLRWQIRRLGVTAPARARLAEALRQLREVETQRPLRLSLGVLVCCVYRGKLWLERAEPAATPARQPWRGEPRLPWADGVVEFVAVVGSGLSRATLERAMRVHVAPRVAGLHLRLAADRPRRSLRKLCQDAGIPAWLRDRLPVLEVDGVPAWVGGIGVEVDFACRPGEPGIEPEWRARD
ncbi:MAG: tRNA lysidine(34) synthetase TilS [Proteobacteria bacterium]|nr:tRNA lysidine(34) synthetase TilS [Pseudomonadota bacterium]